MSKKWGTNTKAEEKRAKDKQEKQEATREREEKKESAKWKDQETEKFQDKQKQKEREKEEQQRKRDEKRRLEEEEEKEMAKYNKKTKFQNEKMTVAQITKKMESQGVEQGEEDEIEDIYNDIDEHLVDAHTIDQALDQLSLETVDKHPEKRVKAAWMKYVDDNLLRIKKENTGMKRTQHLNMLREEWKKAPENPFNQRVAAYNTKI